MAIIKAGTYRFNDVLTDPGVELPAPIKSTLTIDTSPLGGGMYSIVSDTMVVVPTDDYQSNTVAFLISSYTPNDGTFTIGDIAGFYMGGSWLIPSAQNFNITEDTAVSTEFAEWFTENTKEVKAISGKRRFKDQLDYFVDPEVDYNNRTSIPIFGNVRVVVTTEDNENIDEYVSFERLAFVNEIGGEQLYSVFGFGAVFVCNDRPWSVCLWCVGRNHHGLS